VSTLNAIDGVVASNMAIVSAASGGISAFASNATDLTLDMFGYFAPGGNPPLAPTITSVSPSSGPPGTQMTIAGSNLGGAGTVQINGVNATVVSWGPSYVVVLVPVSATSGSISVFVNGFQANSQTFQVTVPPVPSISSLSLTVGPPQVGFKVSGSNFGTGLGNGSVLYSGTTSTGAPVNVLLNTSPVYWSANLIVAQIPAGTPASSGNVVVVVSGVPSTPMPFTVTQPFNCN
jgi:hypothetical protein